MGRLFPGGRWHGNQAGRHPAQRAKAKAAGRKAENSPPIRVLARTGFFARGLMYIALWVLVIGFFDMAVRRLSQVLFDRPAADRRKAIWSRLVNLGKAAVYVVLGYGVGLYLGYQAWRERFREVMQLHELPPAGRRVVEWLGQVGGVARGLVFLIAGIFLIVAAAEASRARPRGLTHRSVSSRQRRSGPGCWLWWRSG